MVSSEQRGKGVAVAANHPLYQMLVARLVGWLNLTHVAQQVIDRRTVRSSTNVGRHTGASGRDTPSNRVSRPGTANNM
jgi:hypothetical protein